MARERTVREKSTVLPSSSEQHQKRRIGPTDDEADNEGVSILRHSEEDVSGDESPYSSNNPAHAGDDKTGTTETQDEDIIKTRARSQARGNPETACTSCT